MPIAVCLAGATGWAGSALARAIGAAPDLVLAAAVARTAAGRRLGDVLNDPALDCVIEPTVELALRNRCDVLVEYTSPSQAKANVLAGLSRGLHVVVGTSGLTDGDYDELHRAALAAGRGVLACGNFALTAVLMQRFAEIAARYLPAWTIIDYADRNKVDAPSGTARELLARLARRSGPEPNLPVHSVRLPGYVLSVEAVFGRPGQRLSIRHDASESAEPYVEGGLIAIREVGRLVGVHRGLDSVLDLSGG